MTTSFFLHIVHKCVSDCSENHAKAGALGHKERQSDRRKLLPATMSHIANACGVVAESATASLRSRNAQKNNKTKLLKKMIIDFILIRISMIKRFKFAAT